MKIKITASVVGDVGEVWQVGDIKNISDQEALFFVNSNVAEFFKEKDYAEMERMEIVEICNKRNIKIYSEMSIDSIVFYLRMYDYYFEKSFSDLMAILANRKILYIDNDFDKVRAINALIFYDEICELVKLKNVYADDSEIKRMVLYVFYESLDKENKIKICSKIGVDYSTDDSDPDLVSKILNHFDE